MKIQSFSAKWLLAITLASASFLPISAQAQRRSESQHRQQTKNEWRNIAIGSSILGLIGIVEKNGTMTTLGTIGALYAASRYEHDRKSQSRIDRSRASIYSKKYVTYKGKRYQRRTVVKNGKKYYQFVRC